MFPNNPYHNSNYGNNISPNQFFPQYSQPSYIQQMQQQQAAQAAQLIRVNGIESAKTYPTLPNSTIVLFDGNEDIFYVISTDASNFRTTRKFSFSETLDDKPMPAIENFVTVAEFNSLKQQVEEMGKAILKPTKTNTEKVKE